LDELEGIVSADENIQTLRNRFREMLNTNDYCYGSMCKLGGRFLVKHKYLLDR